MLCAAGGYSAILYLGRELCYVLLVGIVLSYSISFIILAEPSPASCAALRYIYQNIRVARRWCYSLLIVQQKGQVHKINEHYN